VEGNLIFNMGKGEREGGSCYVSLSAHFSVCNTQSEKLATTATSTPVRSALSLFCVSFVVSLTFCVFLLLSGDRMPFLTPIRNGTVSLVPADNVIRNNMMINNYNPQEAVDNDDGERKRKRESVCVCLHSSLLFRVGTLCHPRQLFPLFHQRPEERL
jgi:hypothetical protein